MELKDREGQAQVIENMTGWKFNRMEGDHYVFNPPREKGARGRPRIERVHKLLANNIRQLQSVIDDLLEEPVKEYE